MVAKVFLGEEDRPSEPETLYKVKEVSDVHDTVEDHIPVLLCHQTVTNPTSSIREALDFLEPTKGSRVYILVFPKLSPITKLHGDDLFNVWRRCMLGHIILWKVGVYHQDVSPGNMMWYYDKLGKLMGVLNDYDLSSLADESGPQGNERTGTVPFMAIDLLTERAQRGEVKHLYRHDMESFVWVFIWICFRYDSKGALLSPSSRRFDEWATLGAFQCRKDKRDFLHDITDFPRPNVGRRTWRLLTQCAWVLKKDLDRLSDQKYDQLIEAYDQSDDDEEEKDEHENANEDEVKVEESVDGLPGAVKQPEDETSIAAIEAFLRMFTETKGWKELERRIRSR
ncbi:hypothetical protein DEU56DRAFT_903741 [Suillus clintonianus]|uniref:uncharacterized protein n=1 Tax=Suillus clintonianus TaxID=1904413 RepID=UPI001B86E5CA|nr:uncharacterized protein DEU56DRAFT_903741 [Suillus clintonianus]KAG2125387.1 hypothetical protein DEU56DRAFT_903741 [Suillus clintonianus]